MLGTLRILWSTRLPSSPACRLENKNLLALTDLTGRLLGVAKGGARHHATPRGGHADAAAICEMALMVSTTPIPKISNVVAT
jgi:hypothetical protein